MEIRRRFALGKRPQRRSSTILRENRESFRHARSDLRYENGCARIESSARPFVIRAGRFPPGSVLFTALGCSWLGIDNLGQDSASAADLRNMLSFQLWIPMAVPEPGVTSIAL